MAVITDPLHVKKKIIREHDKQLYPQKFDRMCQVLKIHKLPQLIFMNQLS